MWARSCRRGGGRRDSPGRWSSPSAPAKSSPSIRIVGEPRKPACSASRRCRSRESGSRRRRDRRPRAPRAAPQAPARSTGSPPTTAARAQERPHPEGTQASAGPAVGPDRLGVSVIASARNVSPVLPVGSMVGTHGRRSCRPFPTRHADLLVGSRTSTPRRIVAPPDVRIAMWRSRIEVRHAIVPLLAVGGPSDPCRGGVLLCRATEFWTVSATSSIAESPVRRRNDADDLAAIGRVRRLLALEAFDPLLLSHPSVPCSNDGFLMRLPARDLVLQAFTAGVVDCSPAPPSIRHRSAR